MLHIVHSEGNWVNGKHNVDYLSNINLNIDYNDVYNVFVKYIVKYSYGPDGIPSVNIGLCIFLYCLFVIAFDSVI